MLALVTFGVLVAMRYEPAADTAVAVKAPVTGGVTATAAPASPQAGSTLVTTRVRSPQADRALRKAVPITSSARSWSCSGSPRAIRVGRARRTGSTERTLAGALLSETRLYRQAALQDGATDVARVMRDLETVLLEASMSDKKTAPRSSACSG